MSLNLRMPEKTELKPRILVFGVGGAGGNAVNNMIDKELEGAEFVVANTDAQALSQSNADRAIQMGAKVTEGLGAGAKPEVGASAAKESIEEIVDHLSGSHMCFITAGMGGGTGTGGAPEIAKAAREMGILTVGVVTKPFTFEGSKRMKQAEAGIAELQKHVDTLIIIPNQNLFRLANEKTTFTEAFMMADDVLYQGVKGVTDLMVRPGLINLDFADVRSVMDEMGKAMMGTGEAEGETRAVDAAERAIANPLLDEISLKGARGVLINVTGGHDMTLFELDEAAGRIRKEVDDDANIIVGSTMDPSLDGVLRVSVVATGIDVAEGQRSEPARTTAVEEIAAPTATMPPLEPAPVAEPVAEPAPTTVSDLLAPAVAQAREPGQPSSDTLQRLQAAVAKVPEAQPEEARRVEAAEPEAEPERRAGFGINTLIGRMTGQAEGAATPAPAPAAVEPRAAEPRVEPPRMTIAPRPVAPAPRPVAEEDDRQKIEIPAFLRRQAN